VIDKGAGRRRIVYSDAPSTIGDRRAQSAPRANHLLPRRRAEFAAGRRASTPGCTRSPIARARIRPAPCRRSRRRADLSPDRRPNPLHADPAFASQGAGFRAPILMGSRPSRVSATHHQEPVRRRSAGSRRSPGASRRRCFRAETSARDVGDGKVVSFRARVFERDVNPLNKRPRQISVDGALKSGACRKDFGPPDVIGSFPPSHGPQPSG